MGLIRKTLSVGTIGLISFRSKKERLARAERAQLDAEESLEREHFARVAAERRAKHPKRGKHAKRERMSRRERKKRERRNEAVAVAAERGRRAGRRARKAANRSVDQAKVAATSVKEAAVPKVESLATRAADAIDHLTTHES